MPFIDWTVFPDFLIFAFVMTLTPGMNNILVFLLTLHFGVWQAIKFRLGVVVGFPLMTFLVAVFLAPILAKYEGIRVALEFMGTLLLLYLAYRIYISSPIISKDHKVYGFWHGFLLQVANGKAWSMSFVAATMFTNPDTAIFTQGFTIMIGFAIANVICTIPWILAPYVLKDFLYTPRNMRIVNYVFATMVVYMAISPYFV